MIEKIDTLTINDVDGRHTEKLKITLYEKWYNKVKFMVKLSNGTQPNNSKSTGCNIIVRYYIFHNFAAI